MKTSELIKILKRHGCFLRKHSTNHDQYWSPITKMYFVVPRHPNKEVPTGTCEKILKTAGIKQ